MAVAVGDKAPDFTLPDTEKKLRSLGEFLTGRTILAFYPGAFTGVCTKEMCSFRDQMAAWNQVRAQVVGISVDGPAANKAFAEVNHLEFPLLSDYTREVSRQYGGIHEDFWGLKGYHVSRRAVYVLDGGGVVQYVWEAENPGLEPPYGEVKKAAASILIK